MVRVDCRKISGKALAAMASLAMLTGMGFAADTANAANAPVKADINVQRIDGLSDDFIDGADISSMLSLEESGVTFKNQQGTETDLFKLLKNNGWNWARLRVWNDPFTADGQGYGGGNVNADRALIMARRATAAGLKVLVDFHYSDFWADPGKQQVPKTWKSFEGDVSRTSQAVYDYTKDTLKTFKSAGVDVGMVQIGNETSSKIAGISGWNNMSKVFNAGSRAVREIYRSAKVAIHFTNPEKGDYLSRAANLDSYGVDYDVFASSYYPFWHGTPENLTKQLKQVASTYHKDVMVAETSWAYTLEDGDDDSNTVPSKVSAEDLKKYEISAQGQADEFHDVAEAVHNVGDNDGDGNNDGLGVFYWEPAWLPVGAGGKTNADLVSKWNTYGGGWATEAAGEYDAADAGKNWGGTGVDNQALFSFDGVALPSLATPQYLRTGAVTGHVFKKIVPVELTIESQESNADIVAAIKSKLPEKVTAEYKDGVDETESVTWNDSALDWIRGTGTYTISGVTTTNHTATATVVVTDAPSKEWIEDGSFEDTANDEKWTIVGKGISIASKNPSEGKRALAFWAADDYSFSVTRVITGISPGEYVLTAKAEGAYVNGDAEHNTLLLSATSGGATSSEAFTLSGWNQWSKPEVPVTVGEDGTVTIVISGNMAAEDWGSVDELSLAQKTTTPTKPDTSIITEAVARANNVDRSRYTNDSLTALDQAVESAKVLLASSAYTDDDVEAIVKLVNDSIANLKEQEIVSLGVTARKTSYHVGDSITDTDLDVVGNYAGGMGAVTLNGDQYKLNYDFSKPGDAISVQVVLVSNPTVSETYQVKVIAKNGQTIEGSESGSDADDQPTGSTLANKNNIADSGQKESDSASTGKQIADTGAEIGGIHIVTMFFVLVGIAMLIAARRHAR